MKQIFLCLFLLFLLTHCGSVSNPEAAINKLHSPQGINRDLTDSIAAVLSRYPNHTQLAIALVNDDTTYFYGALRKNDTLLTISNKDSVFEIGSMSKVFTAVLMADQVLKGNINPDDSIQQYLDFPLHQGINFTFANLANHTSGLPRVHAGMIWSSILHMDNPYEDLDKTWLENYLAEAMQLESNPGEKYQYSNIGAGILGYLLSRISGKSYESMLQSTIFGPLQMANSTSERDRVQKKLVIGMNKRGRPTSYWDLAALKGAGGILSSAKDLASFARAHFDSTNKQLALTHKKSFEINKDMAMGWGWHILSRKNGNQWHWHNGGTGGFRCSMALHLAEKKGVVVLANIGAGHKEVGQIDRLSFSLLTAL